MEQGPPLGQRIPDWSPSAPAARRGWAAGAAGSSEAERSEGRGTGRRRGGALEERPDIQPDQRHAHTAQKGEESAHGRADFLWGRVNHVKLGCMAEREEITQLLSRWREGDGAAFERLFPLMYRELRQLAQSYLSQEKAGHTLQGTALVHEAYLRLLGQREVDWRDRGHFFAVAAQAMRRILVDHARRQKAAKRGFGEKVVLEEGLAAGETGPDFEALDEALTRLSAVDERRAKVVELRFFGGMTEGEMARHLEVSPATVRRDWALARAWLYRELSEEARG